MRGLTQGEQSTVAWPVLQFWCRSGTTMADPYSASFVIQNIRDYSVAPVTVVVSTALTVGQKLGTGRYVIPTGSTAAWSLGTHRVVVTYTLSAGGPSLTQAIEFEVLDAVDWVTGGSNYLGYISTRTMYQEGHAVSTDTRQALHRTISEQSRRLDEFTGRCFHPEYRSVYVAGSGTEWLFPLEPIIAVEKIEYTWLGDDAAEEVQEIEAGSWVTRMTHLDGERGRDSRIFVGIEMLSSWSSDSVTSTATSTWSDVSRAYKVTGVFGYTDGATNPAGLATGLGETPRPLQRVLGAMCYAALEDANLQDPAGGASDAVMIKTRDQTWKRASGAGSVAQSGGGIFTGNPDWDRIIARYVMPTHIAVAGRSRNWSSTIGA